MVDKNMNRDAGGTSGTIMDRVILREAIGKHIAVGIANFIFCENRKVTQIFDRFYIFREKTDLLPTRFIKWIMLGTEGKQVG